MALFNYASKEITLKVVYYGPGLCGKTTNLQKLHTTMSSDKKGKLLSLSTDADRTLFFDFMPVQLGKIKDFNIRFQLYTVPGQVRYNATRKLVLKGADAVVFVADSQKAMKEANIDSLQNMKENLIANNINPDEIPVVLQYNKRDLKNIMPVDEMNADINPTGDGIIEASAFESWGVDETFKLITRRLLMFISKKHNIQIAPPEDEATPAAAPAPAAAAKESINISVRDKAEDELNAPSGQYDSGNMNDMLETGADTTSVLDEDWTGDQNDIDTALNAHGGPKAAPAPSATADEDIFGDANAGTPPAGDSLLEKMLVDEQQGTSLESLAPSIENTAPAVEDSSVSADIMSEILTEIRETKKLQMEMREGLKQVSTALRALISRIAPKQPTKK